MSFLLVLEKKGICMAALSGTRCVLVRHGETPANREFRYIGSASDHALSERGSGQAVHLADALAVLPVTAVYSSPLQRAYHTAVPIAARHSIDVRVEEALREVHFGSWEGLTRAEVLARSTQDQLLLANWERDPTVVPPGGESMNMVQARVSAVIEHLAQRHPHQTIVLVSHVVVIKAFLCLALGAPLSSAFHIFLDPASISVLDWQQGHSLVRLLNSHAHLGWEQARWMQS